VPPHHLFRGHQVIPLALARQFRFYGLPALRIASPLLTFTVACHTLGCDLPSDFWTID
jgi:hypothetical protein